MGNSGSKAARTAAGSATRKYPSTVSRATTEAPNVSSTNASRRAPLPGQSSRPGPTVRPQPQATDRRTEAINLDGQDPAYASSLRTLGAVNPYPQFSNSSLSPMDPQPNNPTSMPTASDFSGRNFPDPRSNPAVMLLAARERIRKEAEADGEQFARRQKRHRTFLDAISLQNILRMRDQRGMSVEQIEQTMELEPGTMAKLGAKGVVEVA